MWAICLAATIAGLAASVIARDKAGALACFWVLAGLCLTLLFFHAMPPDWAYTAYGALWVFVGSLVMRANLAAGALLIASGLCYGWAWLAAVPIERGHLPLILADAAGFAALALIAGGSIRGLVGAGGFLDSGNSRRGALFGGWYSRMAKKEAP